MVITFPPDFGRDCHTWLRSCATDGGSRNTKPSPSLRSSGPQSPFPWSIPWCDRYTCIMSSHLATILIGYSSNIVNTHLSRRRRATIGESNTRLWTEMAIRCESLTDSVICSSQILALSCVIHEAGSAKVIMYIVCRRKRRLRG